MYDPTARITARRADRIEARQNRRPQRTMKTTDGEPTYRPLRRPARSTSTAAAIADSLIGVPA